MKRRRLLQWFAALPAIFPFARLRVFAQPRELTPEAIAVLHEIGATVLPSLPNEAARRSAVDKFVVWTRGYREGVALAHGYGHPRLQRSGASPVPRYLAQLASLESDASARGGRWSALDLESRRALLDAAFVKAGVRSLPPRPAGQHVVADLMAHFFRSSEANDLCYHAAIGREVCRPIQITTRKPTEI